MSYVDFIELRGKAQVGKLAGSFWICAAAFLGRLTGVLQLGVWLKSTLLKKAIEWVEETRRLITPICIIFQPVSWGSQIVLWCFCFYIYSLYSVVSCAALSILYSQSNLYKSIVRRMIFSITIQPFFFIKYVNMEEKCMYWVWVCYASVCFCVQHEESVKRRQERSVELLNLREELGEYWCKENASLRELSLKCSVFSSRLNKQI